MAGGSAEQAVAIVMAAGKSTRMKSDLPKVLHELCGQPLLAYVLAALEEAGVRRKVVVVGYGAEQVKARFSDVPGVEFVHQTEQKGTGHAVMVCQEALKDHVGPLLILAGDAPMLRPDMLRQMVDRFHQSDVKVLMATAVSSDPFGFGRIVRDPQGNFARIVEQKDASPEEAAIREVNPSFYLFNGPTLFQALDSIRPNNKQGEYYLTDAPAIIQQHGGKVLAEVMADETDILGVNHRMHLAEAHVLMQQRIQSRLMESGVTIVDPRNTMIDARVTIGRDTVIYPFTVIQGPSTIGANCRVGPFAHLREHTVLADGVELGAFVQTVRTQVGSGTIARHLAYLGDVSVGENVNIGAGVVTANFDGKVKAKTAIADKAFLGSGSILIAPVEVGENAVIGAGAVVTKEQNVKSGETVVGVPARPIRPKAT